MIRDLTSKARRQALQAQINVLVGTARGLTQSAGDAPSELRPGILFAARVVEQTAEQIRVILDAES